MERLKLVGHIQPKASRDIRRSQIGLGFEKLDRNVFDPSKAYPFVAQTGVKWARLQSGWQRTEKEKGVYDFAWLDSIVDNIIAIGVEPWLCLCYGNELYTPAAREHFGAVGCPPIHTQQERDAWDKYVRATVAHFKGRIHYYEIWNEPDGQHCWKHGPNAQELGAFNIATAKACKDADPTCEVLGFCTCRDNRFSFLEYLCETGLCDHIDGITYHSYRIHDKEFEESFHIYDEIRKKHNPKLKIVQGFRHHGHLRPADDLHAEILRRSGAYQKHRNDDKRNKHSLHGSIPPFLCPNLLPLVGVSAQRRLYVSSLPSILTSSRRGSLLVTTVLGRVQPKQ